MIDMFGGVERVLQMLLGVLIIIIGVVFIVTSSGATVGIVKTVLDVATPVGKISKVAGAVDKAV